MQVMAPYSSWKFLKRVLNAYNCMYLFWGWVTFCTAIMYIAVKFAYIMIIISAIPLRNRLHWTRTNLGIFQHESTTNITHFVLQLPCKSIATSCLASSTMNEENNLSHVWSSKEEQYNSFTLDVKETLDAIMINFMHNFHKHFPFFFLSFSLPHAFLLQHGVSCVIFFGGRRGEGEKEDPTHAKRFEKEQKHTINSMARRPSLLNFKLPSPILQNELAILFYSKCEF